MPRYQKPAKEKKTPDLDEGFAERLGQAMTVQRVRPSDLALDMLVHPTTVSAWRRGVRPRPALLARLAEILGVDGVWLSEGTGAAPTRSGPGVDRFHQAKPARARGARSEIAELGTDDPEGAGWLWEDPREAEDAFRTYIRNVERSVRGMVGDPDGVKLKELRLIVVDMARSGARAAGRAVPAFVQVVENEIISGAFR